MRILVVSARAPTAAGKGDQLRAFQFVQALAGRHEVDVVTTGSGRADPRSQARLAEVATVVVHRVSVLARLVGVLGAVCRGQPAQVGWMMPGSAWRTVRRRARQADIVLAITVRSVRTRLPCPIALDHVDALSVNMRRRAQGPEPPWLRTGAALEALLLKRWERRLTRVVATQMAISPVDARLLPSPPPVFVVPNAVRVRSEAPGRVDREIDVILTGNMSYPPNRDAAEWLSREIGPNLWNRRPETRICVVGRDADQLRLDGRIEVQSDVPDLEPYLARAKVALAPLRIGTGSPNKVLEAMVAGAAVVATPAAVESFEFPAAAVSTAETAQEIAAAAAALLDDDALRARHAGHGLSLAAAFGEDAQRERLERILSALVPAHPA